MKKIVWCSVFTAYLGAMIMGVSLADEQTVVSRETSEHNDNAQLNKLGGQKSVPTSSLLTPGKVELNISASEYLKQMTGFISTLSAIQNRLAAVESAVACKGEDASVVAVKGGVTDSSQQVRAETVGMSENVMVISGRLGDLLRKATFQQKKKVECMLRADEILQSVPCPEVLAPVIDTTYRYTARNSFFDGDGIFSELNASLLNYADRMVTKLLPYLKGAILGKGCAAEKRFFVETDEIGRKLKALRNEESEIARSNHVSESYAISKIVEWESNYLMASLLQDMFDQGIQNIETRLSSEVNNFLPFAIGDDLRCSNKIIYNYLKSKESIDKAGSLYKEGKSEFMEYDKALGKLPGELDLEHFIEQADQLLDILWAKKAISDEEWKIIIHEKAKVPLSVKYEVEKDEKGNVRKDRGGKELKKKVYSVPVYKPTQHKSITSMLKYLEFAQIVRRAALALESNVGTGFMEDLSSYVYDDRNFSASKIERGEITKKYDEFKKKLQTLRNRGSVIKILLKQQIDLTKDIENIKKSLSVEEQKIFKQLSGGITPDEVDKLINLEEAYKRGIDLRDTLLAIVDDTRSKKGYVTGERYWKYFPKTMEANAFVNNAELAKPVVKANVQQPAQSSKSKEAEIKEELRQKVMGQLSDEIIPESVRREFAKAAKLASDKVSLYGTDGQTVTDWIAKVDKLDVKRLLYPLLLDFIDKHNQLIVVQKKLNDVFNSECDVGALSKKVQDLENNIDKTFDDYRNNFLDVVFTKALEKIQVKGDHLQSLQLSIIGYLEDEKHDSVDLDKAIENLKVEIKKRQEIFNHTILLKKTYGVRIRRLLEYAFQLKNYKGKIIDAPSSAFCTQVMRVLQAMKEISKKPKMLKLVQSSVVDKINGNVLDFSKIQGAGSSEVQIVLDTLKSIFETKEKNMEKRVAEALQNLQFSGLLELAKILNLDCKDKTLDLEKSIQDSLPKSISDGFNLGEFFMREFVLDNEKLKSRCEELMNVISSILSRDERAKTKKFSPEVVSILKELAEVVEAGKFDNIDGVLERVSLDGLAELNGIFETGCQSAYAGFTGLLIQQLNATLNDVLRKDSKFGENNADAISCMRDKKTWFDQLKMDELSADERIAVKEYVDRNTFVTKSEELCEACENIKKVIEDIRENRVPTVFSCDEEAMMYNCGISYLQNPMPGTLVSFIDVASNNRITTSGSWIDRYNEQAPLGEALKDVSGSIPSIKVSTKRLEASRADMKKMVSDLSATLSDAPVITELGAVLPPPPPPPPPPLPSAQKKEQETLSASTVHGKVMPNKDSVSKAKNSSTRGGTREKESQGPKGVAGAANVVVGRTASGVSGDLRSAGENTAVKVAGTIPSKEASQMSAPATKSG